MMSKYHCVYDTLMLFKYLCDTVSVFHNPSYKDLAHYMSSCSSNSRFFWSSLSLHEFIYMKHQSLQKSTVLLKTTFARTILQPINLDKKPTYFT